MSFDFLGFVIYRKSDNKIIAIEHNHRNVSNYNTEVYNYIHWNMSKSDKYPDIDQTLNDTRTYDIKREAAYKLEADELFVEAQANIRDGTSQSDAEATWLAKRNEIKIKYPKPS